MILPGWPPTWGSRHSRPSKTHNRHTEKMYLHLFSNPDSCAFGVSLSPHWVCGVNQNWVYVYNSLKVTVIDFDCCIVGAGAQIEREVVSDFCNCLPACHELEYRFNFQRRPWVLKANTTMTSLLKNLNPKWANLN